MDRSDPARGGEPIALVVDAGPLYAYVDADDRHHRASLALLESHPGPLLVPALVVTEVAYLIGARLGVNAEVRFLGDLAAERLGVTELATVDHRHFTVVRPLHTAVFRRFP